MGTVGKALDLLDLFTLSRPQVGLSDLARLAGINKATCHRLMTEMAERGLVEQVGPAREYRLGPAVLRLAALRETTVPTRDAAMPALRHLADAVGETAHLSLLSGGRVLTLAFAYSARHGVKVMMEDADILPPHATASGQAILAYRPVPEVEAMLARPLPRLTPATVTDPGALRDRLAMIRAQGLSETVSTFEADVHGFAVPLFDALGNCTGAIAVAAAAPRVTPALRAAITGKLTRAGAQVTAAWGGRLPADLAALWNSMWRDAA